MPQINLGRVQGKSIAQTRKKGATVNLVDTYEVVLDDNTVAGEFTVTNGGTAIATPTQNSNSPFSAGGAYERIPVTEIGRAHV